MENIIEIRNLNKEIKGKTILTDVNFVAKGGEIVGIAGENGSGKTVLLKTMLGFMKSSSGEIFIQGKQIGKEVDFPSNCGIIIETPGFIGYRSGFSNLKYLASLSKRASDGDIKQTMKLLGLNYTDRKPVAKYSLGMKQRLGIAQAIMEKPELLVLDEPFNSLDKEGVCLVRNLLLTMKEEGKTIILVSHFQEDINALCDRVYEISGGTLREIENKKKENCGDHLERSS